MDIMQLNALIMMFFIGVVWLGVGAIIKSEKRGLITLQDKIIHYGGAAFWLAPPMFKLWTLGVL